MPKENKKIGRPQVADKQLPVRFRAPQSHIAIYEQKAAEKGLTFSEFCRRALDKFAGIRQKRSK